MGSPRSTRTGASGGRPQGRRTAAERRAAAEARMRAQRAADRRRRLLMILGIVVAVVVIVGGLTWLALRRKGAKTSAGGPQIVPAAPTGSTPKQADARQVTDTSGIPGVLAWDTGDWPGAGTSTAPGILEHQHVAGPVAYRITPPVGGPHNPVWMNAGVYTRPVPAERAVHNMEHGAVWITYRPDLPASQVKALDAFVAKQSLIDESAGSQIPGQKSRYMDLSPWTSDALPSPIVLSAWGHQLRVTSPTDPRMQRFVDTFRNSRKYTPEFGSAVDGIPVQTGGRPAADGATQPNPPGKADSGAGMPPP